MKKLIWLCLLLSPSIFALANPAAVNCTHHGFKYLMVQNVGICVFPDNSYCEEWAYFRGQCKPGQNFPKDKTQNNSQTTTK
jgi:hypothetical protein